MPPVGLPTPTFYITSYKSSVPTVDSTGNYTISTNQVSPTMVLDASRGYAYKINNGGFGLYWNYNYKGAITVSYWLRYTGTNTAQFNDPSALCDSAGNYKNFVQMPANTPYQLVHGGGSSGGVTVTNVTPVYYTNPNWFMVSQTWDGTTAGIYVNGSAYGGTATGLTGTITMNAAGKICIGSLQPNLSAVSANGLLSYIYVWDQILTPTQLNTLYTNT